MTSAPPCPTFRDPSGSLRLEGDLAIREIHTSAREEVLEFVNSRFCQRLQKRGDLVAATIDDAPDGLRLLHPRVPVPTYPWEWTPSMWLAAAELTLNLCEEALSEGWILKDATPLNVLFIGPRPVLVDFLSFERYKPGSSIWLAYGQYVRTFELPLLMNRLLHWPLALSFFKRDGYEPSDLYQAIGRTQRFSPAAFWPITLPALLEKRNGAAASTAQPAKAKDPGLALHVLKRMLASLRKRTRRALPKDAGSEWADYTGTLTHYTPEQSAQKLEWMQQVLNELHPERVLDIGANTGEFSSLAAGMGAQVVALERDAATAERLFCMSRAKNLSIQTVHADAARPTAAAGWDNNETSALLPRLEGRFDLVLMLAVIHHLLLLEQIPLGPIMELCHRITRRYLVIEWVPATDPMYQSLMRGRDTLYGSITEADLLAACVGRFQLLRQLTLSNGRVLFLFERA
ncbi:bifunctional 2-polyprenyl-6-hydroxyphenol methylase/3-demethylubiquinol 3-O-methyltransferase UbiG [Granulicella sp. S156]|uniref:class I SAM-dependent methyltransferase n=1 Tax=Granulicella sp. S156 TaxID=1747224 RepID=UPI00131E9A8D|nr:methyltransferase domain-containing protein [Granulicella sp. S156]